MKEFEQSGRLMPCEFIQKFLIRRMRSVDPKKHIFLVDGYIKSMTMCEYWRKTMGSQSNLLGVIYYKCSKEILVARLKKRAKKSNRDDDLNESLA